MEAREQTRRWPARRVPILGAIVAFWFGAHCTTNSALERARGQSGSEVVSNGGTGGSPGGTDAPGGNVPACPCGGFPGPVYLEDTSRAAAMLRVTLLEHTPGSFDSEAFPRCRAGAPEPGCARVRLRVEEVLGAANASFDSGDELSAVTDSSLPCPLGKASISVGDEALAYVYWLPPELPSCEEREQCVDQCEAEYDAQVRACQRGDGGPCPDTTVADTCERCVYDLEDVCPARPPLSAEDFATRGNLRWTLWEDQLLFAANEQGELRVPANDLSALSRADCQDRFGNWSDLPGAFPSGTP